MGDETRSGRAVPRRRLTAQPSKYGGQTSWGAANGGGGARASVRACRVDAWWRRPGALTNGGLDQECLGRRMTTDPVRPGSPIAWPTSSWFAASAAHGSEARVWPLPPRGRRRSRPGTGAHCSRRRRSSDPRSAGSRPRPHGPGSRSQDGPSRCHTPASLSRCRGTLQLCRTGDCREEQFHQTARWLIAQSSGWVVQGMTPHAFRVRSAGARLPRGRARCLSRRARGPAGAASSRTARGPRPGSWRRHP